MAGFIRYRNCHVQVLASEKSESEAFLFKVGIEFEGKLNPLTGMLINLSEVDRILDAELSAANEIIQIEKLSEFVHKIQSGLLRRLPRHVNLQGVSFDDWPHLFVWVGAQSVVVKWREDFVISSQEKKKKFLFEVTQKLDSHEALDSWIIEPRLIWGDCVSALVKQMPVANLNPAQIYELLETTLDLVPNITGISVRDLADRSLFEVRRVE